MGMGCPGCKIRALTAGVVGGTSCSRHTTALSRGNSVDAWFPHCAMRSLRVCKFMTIKSLVGYVRVSTSQQATSGLGIEAQREALERFAAAEGFQLVRVF